MSWFKLLKDEESMAFGTEEGIQVGMEDFRYFEECCEEARASFIRLIEQNARELREGFDPKDVVTEWQRLIDASTLDCDEFRQWLEDNWLGTENALETIVREWDECEETKHTHRSSNI